MDTLGNLMSNLQAATESTVPRSPLQSYIEQACHPDHVEPDLALNLELCDLINAKQSTYPREAAMYIVKLCNARNSNISLLALMLLDNCVKNCGYPFHLQVASKDFLNELVKRFPTKPPQLPTSTQLRILELLKQWSITIAENSKYKADMRNITDMCRLLEFKGYRFPGVAESSLAVLQQNDSLKSAEEMEEDDIQEKKAKLQELLRRATPGDLEEANKLMKELVGYETKNKIDYKQKEKEELDKIEAKATLFNDMLSSLAPTDIFKRNETLDELLASCKSAQPKLQKFIEDEYANKDLIRLLSLNDVLNGVLSRYVTIRSGGAAPSVIVSSSQNKPPAPISLIDLEETSSHTISKSASISLQSENSNVGDLLAGLSFEQGQVGIGASMGRQMYNSHSFNANTGDIFLPSGNSSSQASIAGGSSLLNFDYASLNLPSTQLQQQQQLPSSQHQIPSFSTSPAVTTNQPRIKQLYEKNGLIIQLSFKHGHNRVDGTAIFSNATLTAMTNLNFQLAVAKTVELQLEPLSSQLLAPNSKQTVTQAFTLLGTNCERIRFRISFESNGVSVDDQGEASLS